MSPATPTSFRPRRPSNTDGPLRRISAAGEAGKISTTLDQVQAAFRADGPLSRVIAGYVAREGQLEMAEAVTEALAGGDCLIAEAGPGAGKTAAYLVPLLLAGRRAVISTHSRNLQDQLFHRDLPMIGEALGRPVKVRMLKGRGNYLCRYRLARTAESVLAPSSAEQSELSLVRSWAEHTTSGDLAECEGLPENTLLWRQITSTRDNCLGKECPDFDSCCVFRARARALRADIVVVNHHVLMAHLQLKAAGADGLLPKFDCVVVDEAHALPEVGRESFALSLSTRQIAEALKDIEREALAHGRWSEVQEAHSALDKAVRDLRLACAREPGESDWTPNMLRSEISLLEFAMDELIECCEDSADEELQPLTNAAAALSELRQRLEVMCGILEQLSPAPAKVGPAIGEPKAHTNGERSLESLRAGWIRVTRSSASLNLTPVDIADDFQRLIAETEAAWVFASATLSMDGDLDHYARRLGLEDARELIVASPYDYRRNTRLFVPQNMPMPGADVEGYTRAMLDAALPLAAAANGRAFLLFTSYRALGEACELLRRDPVWRNRFVAQGAGQARNLLLEEFRRRGDALLLGTRSFWQGVDVRGPNLVLVVIDRLPFEAPGNPVYRARQQALRARGGDPFNQISLPEAVLALKQGVGRLVRGENDGGVVMICDQRLLTKGYGRRFVASLPPMPLIRNADEALEFMTWIGGRQSSGAA
ncbi:ATP-dependent DNA helicase [Candidatus Foliamicus sp.]